MRRVSLRRSDDFCHKGFGSVRSGCNIRKLADVLFVGSLYGQHKPDREQNRRRRIACREAENEQHDDQTRNGVVKQPRHIGWQVGGDERRINQKHHTHHPHHSVSRVGERAAEALLHGSGSRTRTRRRFSGRRHFKKINKKVVVLFIH